MDSRLGSICLNSFWDKKQIVDRVKTKIQLPTWESQIEGKIEKAENRVFFSWYLYVSEDRFIVS